VSEDSARKEADQDESEIIRDGLLTGFVDMANAGKVGFGLTVWTGGAIVSGTLVGITDYFDGVASDFDRAQGEGAEALANAFRTVAAGMRQEVESAERESPTLIHLKHAKTYSPGGRPIPTHRGVWWRGRLDAVDGWCFGELVVEPE
jgi:hypothetical protein